MHFTKKEKRMIKRSAFLLIFVGALLSSKGALAAEKPPGFLWYNLPKESVSKPEKPRGVPFNQLSYTDRDKVLSFYTMEALHKVRFTHSVEDERVFLALQDYWLREASTHKQVNQQALLKYPEFDFSVTHPTSNIGTQITDEVRHQEEVSHMKKLAETSGLLFFYRSKNPYDTRQIPILEDFCRKFGFELIPVSVDGEVSPELRKSRLDRGQAARLNVRYFPAVLLVNPQTKATQPVAFGLTTQDVLTARLMQVRGASK